MQVFGADAGAPALGASSHMSILDQAAGQDSDGARIEDAGAFIPYARKHLVSRSTGPAAAESELTLENLFPEPDWRAKVQQGMPVDCAAWLAMLYDSLATRPRAHGAYGVTGQRWAQAFEQAVRWLCWFFNSAKSLETAKSVARTLAGRLGSNPKDIARLPLTDMAPYWAACPGGKRRLRPLGSFTLRQSAMAQWLPKLGWPASDRALRFNLVPTSLTDGTWRVGQIKGEGYYFKSDALATEAEAIAQCFKLFDELEAASGTVRKRVLDKEMERAGPDYRGGRDIDAQTLIAEFNLRGVQFGESVPQAERQAWLNSVYEGMADLADVLALPRRWMGLGGLGLAIGARGSSAALAHYEPSLRVVNVTRMRGQGALAHEWFHALDHRLGRHHATTYLTAHCFNRRLIVEPDAPLVSTMSALAWEIRASEFLQQAIAIEDVPRAGSYWTKPEELGARAFESWVQDQLVSAGRQSPAWFRVRWSPITGSNPCDRHIRVARNVRTSELTSAGSPTN